MNNQRGFTLVELMIVVVIIGILSSIAIPNFVRMSDNAREASCISNQHNIFEAAILYGTDNPAADGDLNVTVVALAGLLGNSVMECPVSTLADNDDYTVTFASGVVSSMRCDVEPVPHSWTVPSN